MDDIVTWLRSILHNDRSVELRCQEAADEIERLRKELNRNDIYKCTLCNTWGRPVNHFKDCKICSDAQYGD